MRRFLKEQIDSVTAVLLAIIAILLIAVIIAQVVHALNRQPPSIPSGQFDSLAKLVYNPLWVDGVATR